MDILRQTLYGIKHGLNTKIKNLFIDEQAYLVDAIARGILKTWQNTEEYFAGEFIEYSSVLYKVLADTKNGESPVNTPTKFQSLTGGVGAGWTTFGNALIDANSVIGSLNDFDFSIIHNNDRKIKFYSNSFQPVSVYSIGDVTNPFANVFANDLYAINLTPEKVVYTAANGKLTVNNNFHYDSLNGYLGIGTTTPQTTLELVRDGVSMIQRSTVSTGYSSQRYLNDQNSTTRALEVGYGGSAFASQLLINGFTGESAYFASTGNYPMQFGVNNRYSFGISKTNYNVLIGTLTDIGAGHKLQIAGNILPSTDITYSLGQPAYRWNNGYFNNISVSTSITFPSFTQGSILFAGAGGVVSQDNANFNYNSTTKLLSVLGQTKVQYGGISLLIGADDNATTLTNLITKTGILAVPHNQLTEEPIAMISLVSNTTQSILQIGGNLTTFNNSATNIRFYTGTNNTTLSGTEAMRITEGRNLLLGNITGSGRFNVWGSGTTFATYTAQFHNSTGANNALMIRDDGWVGVGRNTSFVGVTGISVDIAGPLTTTVGNTIGGIRSSIYIRDNSTTSNITWLNQAGSQAIFLGRNDGTSTPSFRLGTTTNNNITIWSAEGKQTHTATYTSTINNDYAWNFTGTLTSNPAFSNTLGVNIDPLFVATANNQRFISLKVFNNVSTGAFTGIIPTAYEMLFNSGRYVRLQDNIATNTIQYVHNSDLIFTTDGGARNIYFNNSGVSTRTTFESNGNVIIGSNATASARLHVVGNSTVSGNAFLVQNSGPNNLITIGNNGTWSVGDGAGNERWSSNSTEVFGMGASRNWVIRPSADLGATFTAGAGGVFFGYKGSFAGVAYPLMVIGLIPSQSMTSTNGAQTNLQLNANFAPTSGTATFANLYLTGTINQTGGANGITRGIYVNPTITAAADFRAIETNAGKIIFGGTGVFSYMRNHSLTTAQRDALTGLLGGEQIFNTDTLKHQGYDGTNWNDFY